MTTSRRFFCDTAMGQVHCVESGSGDGVPLILLHQTPRSVDEFKEVLPLLAKHRRTIAVDNPGYGGSDPVEGQPTVADYARSVIAVLDALKVDTAVFVGHHTGAIVSIELAAAFPERVDRVVLSGPVYTDALGRAELSKWFKQWTVQKDGSHLKERWDRFFQWIPDPALVQRIVLDLWRAGETSEQGHFAVALYRMEDRINLVKCPALLIYSQRDPFADPVKSKPVRDAFKPATEVFLDAGVFVANEKPALFAKTILDYLR
jgi:pimeloyl-ACP methyl ester carboxylesterase